MRTSNFALRLQPTLLEEARAMAKEEGVALNQLINVAVAERLAVSRTLEFFANYTRDADVAGVRALLAKAGRYPAYEGDELPPNWKRRKAQPRAAGKSARLLVVSSRGRVRLPDGAVFHAHAARVTSRDGGWFRRKNIWPGSRRRVEHRERLQFVQHLVVDALDRRTQHLLEQLEVDEQTGCIELGAASVTRTL